ncbi:MAG TPA: DUF2203 domain-containing protein [Candidatus Limnocylindrales bacterium]|nr:DUF2203 domain-containing protein [Candidatus Limnocylindrales bacterium]
MTRFYGIDEANDALPDVERILLDLRDQRAELIRLRDAVLAASKPDGGEGGAGEAPPATTGDDPDARDAEAAAARRLMRLRMQGLIDQMQAGVTRLVEREVTLREIEAGLIDFPALASGRQIWLCWRLGEGDIEWWHELDEGFAGRRPLIDLT